MPTVIFDTEWGHDWPLWSDSVEEPLLFPEDLSLSAGLMGALRHFYDFWEAHDHLEAGWDLPGNQQHALDESERLVEMLALELAGRCEVRNLLKRTRGKV